MAGDDEVKLFGYWASPYALRIHWALKLKGIQYQYAEEDLPTKTPLLLQYNPVHKKIPVLVHNGNPVAESLIILEYIDETWNNQYPLLPKDPYERAKARFWANFADAKCIPAVFGTFSKTGEQQKKAVEEAREHLKALESGLEGKRFFGGENINFADIAIGWLGCWAGIVEEIVGIDLMSEERVPLLNAWFRNFFEVPTVKECMPPRDKLVEHIKGFHQRLMAAST